MPAAAPYFFERRSVDRPLLLRKEVTGEGRVKVRPASAVRASGLTSLPAEKARAPAEEMNFQKCPEGVSVRLLMKCAPRFSVEGRPRTWTATPESFWSS